MAARERAECSVRMQRVTRKLDLTQNTGTLETRFLEGGSVVGERRANTSRSYTSRDGERNHGVKISNWFLN